MLQDSIPVAKISIAGSNPDYASQHNVAGETNAAIFAIEWAIDAFKQQQSDYTGVKKLHIFFDYRGIAGWPIGWNAKDALALAYQKRYHELVSADFQVQFHKVNAHTGVHYNEWADQLAKDAAGILTPNPKATPNPFIAELDAITSGLKSL